MTSFALSLSPFWEVATADGVDLAPLGSCFYKYLLPYFPPPLSISLLFSSYIISNAVTIYNTFILVVHSHTNLVLVLYVYLYIFYNHIQTLPPTGGIQQ